MKLWNKKSSESVFCSTLYWTGLYWTSMINFRIKKDGDFDRENKTGAPHGYYTYGVVCTEVEIDVLTGENQVTL